MSWEKVRLKEVLQRVDRSEEVFAASAYEILGVRWYGLGAYSRGEVFGEETTYPRLAAAKLGDVIINKIWTRKGSIAVIDDATQGLYCSPEFPLFEIDPTKAIPAWIKYVTQQPGFWLECENASPGTSGKNRITPERFLEIGIPLPPLPVQRWIADALASVDEWLEVSTAQAESLKSMKMSFIDRILSKMDTEAASVTLSDVGILQTGLQIGKKYQDALKEYPYLRVANVKDGYIDTDIIKVVEIPESEASRRMLKAGDVLITEGGDADKLGRGSIWQGQVENCLHQNHVFAFRPNKRKLLPEYLALALRGAAAKSYFLSSAKQTTNLASINSTQLKAFSLRVPSLKSQKQAVQEAQQLDNWISAERDHISEVHSIRQSLLHQLLSGSLQPQGGWESIIHEPAP